MLRTYGQFRVNTSSTSLDESVSKLRQARSCSRTVAKACRSCSIPTIRTRDVVLYVFLSLCSTYGRFSYRGLTVVGCSLSMLRKQMHRDLFALLDIMSTFECLTDKLSIAYFESKKTDSLVEELKHLWDDILLQPFASSQTIVLFRES